MHLLQARAGGIADGSEAVDLGQSPGEIVVLSAADTELANLAAARAALGPDFPRVRLANLMHLTHNMSVDLYVEQVIGAAKIVVVRLLGGAMGSQMRPAKACETLRIRASLSPPISRKS